MRLFYRARAHRRPILQRWYKNYQVLHNRTWGTGRQDWMPAPEPPEVKPIISSLVAWMTDTEPTFDALPQSNPHDPFSDFYNERAQDLVLCLRSGWQHGAIDAELEKVLWDGFTYGVGFLKTTWDGGLSNGLGDYCIRRIDPFTLYIDPNATSMYDATYFVEVRNMAIQEVERRWPGTTAKLDEDRTYRTSVDSAPNRITPGQNPSKPLANPGAINGTGSSTYGLPGQGSQDRVDVEDDGVTVFEFWMRGPREVPAPTSSEDNETHADDSPTRTIDEWRCVILVGNQVIMDEAASDLWSHAQHPYDRYTPEDTGELYADSLVELLTPLQLSINRNLAAIEHNLWLSGNPVMLESTRAGIPKTKITNRPGQRIPVNGDVNNTVKWLDPPEVKPETMQLINLYIGEMERISGLSAIVRGATPTGRNAQGVLDAVQDAALVRIRLMLRNLERALISAGNKAASNVAEFYDADRIVAIVGPGGQTTASALSGTHFYTSTTEGRVPINFQVLVTVGSKQATSRSAKFSEATTLYAMQMIDQEAALAMIDFPGWHRVVERVKAMQAQAGTLGQPPTARAAAGRTT